MKNGIKMTIRENRTKCPVKEKSVYQMQSQLINYFHKKKPAKTKVVINAKKTEKKKRKKSNRKKPIIKIKI